MAPQTQPTTRLHTKNVWPAVYIAAALTISQVALFIRPIVGVYVNAAVFALLVGLALRNAAVRQLAISAAILPVAMMVSLSLPQSDAFDQTMLFYDTLLLVALVYRFIFTLDQPLPLSQLTSKGYALALPLVLIMGEILGFVGYGMLRHQYPYHGISLSLVALSSVVFAVAEETFFRGLIQQRASLVMPPAMAAVMSTLLYTLMSIGHVTILVPAFALLSGAVLSAVYYKKQNLILTITLNTTMKLVYLGLLATFVLR